MVLLSFAVSLLYTDSKLCSHYFQKLIVIIISPISALTSGIWHGEQAKGSEGDCEQHQNSRGKPRNCIQTSRVFGLGLHLLCKSTFDDVSVNVKAGRFSSPCVKFSHCFWIDF